MAPPTVRLAGLVCALLVSGARGATAADPREPPRLYLHAFQSGTIQAIDTASGRTLLSIPVADAAAPPGLAIRRDGKELFVLDDGGADRSGRLRTIDAATGRVLRTLAVRDRSLANGPASGLHLTRDGRWLLVPTYDPASAAHGVRRVDARSGRSWPLGLSDRRCETPALESAPDGAVLEACGRGISELVPHAGAVGEYERGRAVETDPGVIAALAVPDGGGDLWAIARAPMSVAWRLLRWRRGTGALEARDVVELFARSVDGASSPPLLALRADGGELALARGTRLVREGGLDRPVAGPVTEVALPGEAVALAYPSAGSGLYVVCEAGDGAGGNDARLVLVPGGSASPPVSRPLRGIRGNGPFLARLAPAP